jgi:1-deoxyxylulose-5-phosphate synthase
MDSEDWETPNGGPASVTEVVSHIHQIRKQGIGVIGMKLIGAGSLTQREDRAAAMKFAFQHGGVDAVTVGFKTTEEIDEAIENVNVALA